MRGGYYFYLNGLLYDQSDYGYYWLRRLDYAAKGHILLFYSWRTFTQDSYTRNYGFPVRCLALEKQANTSLTLAPLSLVRGGNYRYDSGTLYNQSSYGRYWSQRLNNDVYGYFLYFNSGLVGPQFSSDRGHGFTLRCLAGRK